MRLGNYNPQTDIKQAQLMQVLNILDSVRAFDHLGWRVPKSTARECRVIMPGCGRMMEVTYYHVRNAESILWVKDRDYGIREIVRRADGGADEYKFNSQAIADLGSDELAYIRRLAVIAQTGKTEAR